MTKHERRRYFERLVQLRALYRIRGGDDDEVAMSVDQALAYGEHLLGDQQALAEVLGPDLSARPASAVLKHRQS